MFDIIAHNALVICMFDKIVHITFIIYVICINTQWNNCIAYARGHHIKWV